MHMPRHVRVLAVCALSAAAPAQSSNPFSGDVLAAEAGSKVFRANCESCHGSEGHAGAAPDLTRGTLLSDQDADLFRTISTGLPGTDMPDWSKRLATDEIWRVVTFL